MTQEEKDLLLKDLCARLPYGVLLKATRRKETWYKLKLTGSRFDKINDNHWDEVKPYLRPMSSMTGEEKEELKVLTDNKFSLRFNGRTIINLPILEIDDGEWHCGSLTSMVDSFDITSLIDWLNAHHFDYRGLIEKGLAIEAPKEMYQL